VEFPLLQENGYILPRSIDVVAAANTNGGVAANDCGVAAGSHDGGAIKIGPIRDVNIMFKEESEAHTETELD
jgi:hypothetical protein